MKIFQKISEKIGLTQTELKVIVFLVAVFLIGIIVKSLNWKNDEPVKNNFDYTSTDNIFYPTNNIKLQDNLLESNMGSSDLNKRKLNLDKKKQELVEKSVNLNKTSLEQLTMLPGIGIKTAERILAYRRASGGFNTINELLEVHGIGEVKFDKIKKVYLCQIIA
jgi:competence ComEA-like helix-hairpin-helix protein